MAFINTLPYISNPIEEFADFKAVEWQKEIYPTFKGAIDPSEMRFFVDLIKKRGLRSILDLGVGGGIDLAGILDVLKSNLYHINSAEANEVDDEFIRQSRYRFKKQNLDIPIHKANWIDLPNATPEYTHLFDFVFLTGNSLTYIGGGTREYTKRAQQSVVSKFAKLIKHDAICLLIRAITTTSTRSCTCRKKPSLKNFHFVTLCTIMDSSKRFCCSQRISARPSSCSTITTSREKFGASSICIRSIKKICSIS